MLARDLDTFHRGLDSENSEKTSNGIELAKEEAKPNYTQFNDPNLWVRVKEFVRTSQSNSEALELCVTLLLNETRYPNEWKKEDEDAIFTWMLKYSKEIGMQSEKYSVKDQVFSFSFMALFLLKDKQSRRIREARQLLSLALDTAQTDNCSVNRMFLASLLVKRAAINGMLGNEDECFRDSQKAYELDRRNAEVLRASVIVALRLKKYNYITSLVEGVNKDQVDHPDVFYATAMSYIALQHPFEKAKKLHVMGNVLYSKQAVPLLSLLRDTCHILIQKYKDYQTCLSGQAREQIEAPPIEQLES